MEKREGWDPSPPPVSCVPLASTVHLICRLMTSHKHEVSGVVAFDLMETYGRSTVIQYVDNYHLTKAPGQRR